eukprot:1150130-Pelagomonas_calceolata.AAC.11
MCGDSPSPQSCRPESAHGDLEITGSTRFQDLAHTSVSPYMGVMTRVCCAESMLQVGEFVGRLIFIPVIEQLRLCLGHQGG